MSEYIYAIDDHGNQWVKWKEIVRCRDCEHAIDSPAWPGAMECYYIGRGVEPDGFCAWAERREQ